MASIWVKFPSAALHSVEDTAREFKYVECPDTSRNVLTYPVACVLGWELNMVDQNI